MLAYYAKKNKKTAHIQPFYGSLDFVQDNLREPVPQKKHSPTHTYRGHNLSLICFVHLLQSMASCSIYVPDTYHNISKFLWSTSWPGTLHFILHTFHHPITLLFAAHAHTNATCFVLLRRLSSFWSLSQPFTWNSIL